MIMYPSFKTEKYKLLLIGIFVFMLIATVLGTDEWNIFKIALALFNTAGIIATMIALIYSLYQSNITKKDVKEVVKEEHIELFNKLSKEVRTIILEDKRDSLSVKELNELLTKKTIDLKSTKLFPYKCCPKCGSENIEEFDDFLGADVDSDGLAIPYWIKAIECNNCGWYDNEEMQSTRDYFASQRLDDEKKHISADERDIPF